MNVIAGWADLVAVAAAGDGNNDLSLNLIAVQGNDKIDNNDSNNNIEGRWGEEAYSLTAILFGRLRQG